MVTFVLSRLWANNRLSCLPISSCIPSIQRRPRLAADNRAFLPRAYSKSPVPSPASGGQVSPLRRPEIMNKLLDVLLLTDDDAPYASSMADLARLGFNVRRYAELADLYAHVSQRAVSLIVLTGGLPKIRLATAQLRAMRQSLGIVVVAPFAT